MSKTKKLSKVLALVIMLALVIGVLPMGAMATDNTVYVRFFVQTSTGFTQLGSTQAISTSDTTVAPIIQTAAGSNTDITSYSITNDKIFTINGIDPTATIDEGEEFDAWLYTVDDALEQDAINEAAVGNNSVITVFYVLDYRTVQFAYVLPDGAATIGNAIAADAGETIYYRIATSTVDFDNLYSTIGALNSVSVTSSTTSLTPTTTVSEYTVLPAFKPVIGEESGTLAAWKSETIAAYNALTPAQKADLLSEYNAANGANATMTQVNALAKEVAPLTRANSTALNRLVFTQNDTYLHIRHANSYKNGFYPNVTAYKLEAVTDGFNIITEALGSGLNVSFSSSDSSSMTVSSTGVVAFTSTAAVGNYTLTVRAYRSTTDYTDYTVSVTYVKAAGASALPTFVNGYLPMGQYASGAMWGGIYSSGTNVNGNNNNTDPTTTTDAPTKITSGYSSTGISLGAPGGYVQLEFASPVQNLASNLYGIDFMVYGNPFVNNPEAASVKVSQDGITWYELAGSRYYNSETIRNTTISYKMIPTSTYGSNKKADIYYAIGTPPTGTGTTGWTLFKAGVVWWPEYTTEGYGKISGITSPLDGTKAVNGVTYSQLAETSNGYNCWMISYSGVTLVKDTDNTDDYLFGYADIRHIGNTVNGTPCNPYASAPSTGTSTMVGGDGYDISWAVDSDGEPVSLAWIKFIRIYSSAALNPSNLTALPTPSVFGETSAEVCGVFVVNGSGTGAAESDLYVVNHNSDYVYVDAIGDEEHQIAATPNMSTIPIAFVNNMVIDVFSDANYVYVNGVAVSCSSENAYQITPTSGGVYQIITQSGTESPYIIVLKVS